MRSIDGLALISVLCLGLVVPGRAAAATGVESHSSTECAMIDPLLNTELTCIAQRPRVEEHFRRCHSARLASGSSSLPSEPEHIASLHAFLVEIFDREQTLMFRRYPVADQRQNWQAFQAKWKMRLERAPQVVAYDQSLNLNETFRGGLTRRVRVVPGTYRKAVEGDNAMQAALGIVQPAGFYYLTAALLIEVLNQPETRTQYIKQLEAEMPPASAANAIRERAEQVLNDQRNLLLLMYPEIELQGGSGVVVNAFLLGNRVRIGDLTTEINAPDFDGKVLPIQDRFARLAREIDRVLKTGRYAPEYQANLEASFTTLHTNTISELDRMVESVLTRSGGARVHEQTWVLNRALLATQLNQSLQQGLRVQMCMRLYNDVFWQKIHDFNQTYVSPVLDASLAAVVLGAGSAGLGVAGMRYLAGRAFGAAISKGLLSGGLWTLRAGGAVLWLGLPASVESFRYALVREWQAHEQFYQVAHLAEYVKGTQLAPLRSATRWESLNLFLNVAPLAFIRF